MQGKPRESGSGKGGGRRRGLDLTAQQWVLAFLVGLATVSAAGFNWKSAAIGSTAAYDDRQSISETIAVEQQTMDVGLTVSNDTRTYAEYLVDYAAAAELENQAAGLTSAGDQPAATVNRQDATLLRRNATERAAAAGLFGEATIGDDVTKPRPTPRPFSLEQQTRARIAEEETAVDSPGKLNPDQWAGDAEQIRDRINGMAVWALVVLFAVLMFSIAEANSKRRQVFYAAMGIGLAVLVSGIAIGLSTDFIA